LPVDDHDFAVAHQPQMLQAIVGQDDVRAICHRLARRGDPILGHEYRGLGTARQQQRFVTHFRSTAVQGHSRDAPRAAAITARDNGHAQSTGGQMHREPGHQRRLASAPHGEIAHHHHGHRHARAIAQPDPVQEIAQPHDRAIQKRERREPQGTRAAVPQGFELGG
jgi:hypothetical protein